MKHYDELLELGCFSRGDIATMLGNDETAGSLLREYQKKGYIERVRRDLYTVISLETKQPVLSRYQIGCHIFKDCILSHHSAFEYYGYANQVFYEVYVSTFSRPQKQRGPGERRRCTGYESGADGDRQHRGP